MFENIKASRNRKSLNIIIVGCGKVGYTLCERLSKENNTITVIDTDSERVDTLSNTCDVMGITGNGASIEILEKAEIKKADMLIAVTTIDELNILACSVAKGCNDSISTVARVSSPDYTSDLSFLREKLGITMIINPNYETAEEAAGILTYPDALDVNSFAHNQAAMIKIKVTANSRLKDMTIAEYGSGRNLPIVIAAVERGDEVIIPYGSLKMQEKDTIYFVTARKNTKHIIQDMVAKNSTVKSCIIVGGCKTGFYLARKLVSQGVSVKIIEKDLHTCEKLSELLPNVTIINGDGSDASILEEEGLATVDAFVPLTGIDEENILLTLHAKKFSNAKIITKIDRNTFRTVVNELDLGSILYPKYITSEAIIAYARARKASVGSDIEALYNICDNKAEAIEFAITDNKKITNIPLKDLPIKKNVVICFICRNGHIIIPTGEDEILNGDTIMIATTESGLNDISNILI